MVERQQLVSQINNANVVVSGKLNQLRVMDKRFASMQEHYQQQIISNIKMGNDTRAKILANELSNLKKIRGTAHNTQIALEALVIRFSTINELAMIMDTIEDSVELTKGIQSDLAKAIPQASEALAEVSSVTADVLASSNVRGDVRVSTTVDADAFNILNEIEGALESEAKAKLPEVPANMPVHHAEEEEQRQEVLVEG
jgi:division protein CdvB (Snf7/Vps24/ESCRT-III family)